MAPLRKVSVSPPAHVRHTHRLAQTHTDAQQASTVAALTGILPEEALGAPEVLPDQRRVPLEIIHEDFVQSLRPVNSVDDVGVWGGRGGRQVN